MLTMPTCLRACFSSLRFCFSASSSDSLLELLPGKAPAISCIHGRGPVLPVHAGMREMLCGYAALHSSHRSLPQSPG